MKSLMLFLREVLTDVGTWCHTSTSLDYKYIQARVKHEGLSFLTITLPNFGADFQKSLDQGFVDRNLFQGFPWQAGLPRFLGGFLDLVFDRGTGRLLDTPNIDAIRAVRQISLMFGKILLPCTPEREQKAIDKYIQCEQDVREYDMILDEASKERFTRIGRLLWANIFSKLDHQIYNGDIRPKHGPGATADRLKGNLKYNQKLWTERLESIFPSGMFLTYSWSSYLTDLSDLTILEPEAEIPVRVITVPKTLKTPRIIAVEPTHMQYMQQAILGGIEKLIDEDDISSKLISWASQEPNQLLAKVGSETGSLATLDLSEASDRVSNQHVRLLLADFPSLSEAVDATRSRKADVQGQIIRLSKFASMGSALCFPFEAIVFATVIFCGIEKVLKRRLTRHDIYGMLGQVRVYGDDIIVPVDYVEAVVHELETFGFRVGMNKSFWTGKFRESCGKEYYDGHDVSITRVRRTFPTQRQHAPEIASAVSLRNQLFSAGYVRAVAWLDVRIESLIPFPFVRPSSQALGRWNHGDIYDVDKFHPDLHQPLVRAAVLSEKLPSSKLDGYGALMKYFLKDSDLPFADQKHLERAGRPVSVDIKTRLVRPY